MLGYIEFDAILEEEGIIHIPEEYRMNVEKSDIVHVIVKTGAHARRPMREGEDALSYYLENPIFIPGAKAPSRDELYEGR